MNFGGLLMSFSKVAEWLLDFLVLNAIWLLFNFPIVYLMIDLLFRKSVNEIFTLLSVIIILIPFLMFPASSAMFGITRRWIIKLPVGNIFKRYILIYKENYMRSMISGLLFLPLLILWSWNFLLADIPYFSLKFYFHLIILFIIISIISYFIADMVHVKISFVQSLQKVVFMAFFYFPYTLGAAAAAIIMTIILILIHPVLFILYVGSLVSYIYFFAYYQIYIRAKEKTSEVHIRQSN